jgi:predicted Zn-dependent protease
VNKTPIKEIIILIVILAASILLAVGIVRLISKPGKGGKDESGTRPIDSISIGMENNIRGLIKTQLDAEERYLKNKDVTDAVTKIKDRLLPLIKDNPFKVDILVVDSPTVNAVTFPGGLIVVYSGLIKYTNNAEELASIITHELGHVVHRDSMNLLVRNFTLSFLLNLVGAGKSPQLANEIIRNLINSSYSREQEESADSFALELLTKAGIDPLHMAHMFETFQKLSGSDKGLLKYFSTHPALDSRRKKALESAALFAKNHIKEKKFDIDWSKVKKALPSVLD